MATLWVLPEELGEYTDSEYAYEACVTASYILWALSGRKYRGYEEVTERYPVATHADYTYHNDVDFTAPIAHTRGLQTPLLPFADPSTSRIRLRGQPVKKIYLIKNSTGQVISNSNYQLENNAVLFNKTGYSGDLEITYLFGAPPPMAGRMAARAFALELAKGWSGSDDCALPERVTSISREGVSYTILDNQTFLDDLKTGIYQVDLFLKIANPDKARTKAKVFSPDQRRGTQVSRITPTTGVGGWNISPRGDD